MGPRSAREKIPAREEQDRLSGTTGLIGCYCRVSTRRQKNDSQKAEITRWLQGQGIPATSVRWFEDHETGKTLDRPAFDQLQRALFDGAIRTVVVWKLDRISRRLRDGINLLADWCERGIRVVVVTQQVDLSGAVGRMILATRAIAAQLATERGGATANRPRDFLLVKSLEPQLRYAVALVARKMTWHRWDSVPKGKASELSPIGNSQRCFLRPQSSIPAYGGVRLRLRFESAER